MAGKPQNQSTPDEPMWRVIALFTIVTLGTAMGNLSMTALNTMIPSAMREFGVEVDLGQWMTTSYMLVLGIAVPLATYLARRLSERAYVLLAFGLFIAGTLIDFVAMSFAIMVIGRVVQAIAVALLMPFMQTIAITRFPHGRQGTAMGVAGIALGFAPNIGPTVGGAMEFAFGWRSFFLALLIVLVVLFVLAVIFVKKGAGPDTSARFEGLSFVLSTLGFGGLLLGLSNASSFGMVSPWVLIPAVFGMLFLVLFVRRQREVDQPIIQLSTFESKPFAWSIVALLFMFASFMGVTLVIPLYVQDLCGGTSLEAGMVLFPATFVALVMNPVAGILGDKFGMRPVIMAASAVLVLGSVVWCFIDETTPLWVMMVYQSIRAAGVSSLIGPMQTFCLRCVETRYVSDASSTTVLARQIGSAMGTSAMVFIVVACIPLTFDAGFAPVFPYQASFAFSALCALIACVIMWRHVK